MRASKLGKMREQLIADGIMVDGLTTSKTYLVLTDNKRKGIQLSVRPFVERVSEHVVVLWAKVRIAFDSVEKMEKAGADEEAQITALETYFKGVEFPPFDRKSKERVRFAMYIPFVIGNYDKKFVENQFDASAVAHNFLAEIENMLGEKVPNHRAVKTYLTTLVAENVAELTTTGNRAQQTKASLIGSFGPTVFGENNYDKMYEYLNEVSAKASEKLTVVK